jgi:hypothetical protein
MEIKFDEATGDTMIIFSREKPYRSLRIDEDTVFWYAESGKYVYLQIRKSAKHIDKPREVSFEVFLKSILSLIVTMRMNKRPANQNGRTEARP